jgi:hypothetical protein
MAPENIDDSEAVSLIKTGKLFTFSETPAATVLSVIVAL